MTNGRHAERHRTERVGWLRAAVLGANDGIVSTSGLVVGMAASGASPEVVLASGVAGAVAGAISMAAGEYVSVQSQADTERADLDLERRELREEPARELAELARIYVDRGLSPALAKEVARELSAKSALEAHARDELGITESLRARPVQAALASAAAFSAGSILPIATVLLAPVTRLEAATVIVTLVCLVITGGLAAHTGGASIGRGALRVVAWGAVAMAVTTLVGTLFQISSG